MNSSQFYPQRFLVAEAEPTERAVFIRRTYAHLALALVSFAVLESYLLSLPFAQTFSAWAGNRYVWLAIIAAFMGVSHLADHWARSDSARWLQYLGLGVYVSVEALIFVPLLSMAQQVSPAIIPNAVILTGMLTAGLTLVCFSTRADFSPLRNFLALGGFVALGLILCSALFGFGLGLIFSAVMIALASASILYTTSTVLLHYRTDQHVAAALCLFSAIALLFWYIVRILIQLYGSVSSKS